jgi:hypothetical protein
LKESGKEKKRARNTDLPEDISEPLALDGLEIVGNGGIPLEMNEYNSRLPDQLLGGGHHFDDTSAAFRQQYVRRFANDDPRERLRRIVERQGLSRPIPVEWKRMKKAKK